MRRKRIFGVRFHCCHCGRLIPDFRKWKCCRKCRKNIDRVVTNFINRP